MLRGVNVGGHKQIKMDALRALCESLGLKGAQTYVQSGNVVFQSKERELARLSKRIADGIERMAGFRPEVMLRTRAEMSSVVARNPFAKRSGIEPGKLLVYFMASEPSKEARELALKIKADPEELRIDGHELYIYYPNGSGRAKLSLTLIERTLKVAGTGRNWNTVTKLLEMAEELEG